jgi:hypothetical protein
LAAPKEIVDLVERFERNLLEYKSSAYNEAQTRQEFINPFSRLLDGIWITSRAFLRLIRKSYTNQVLKWAAQPKLLITPSKWVEI